MGLKVVVVIAVIIAAVGYMLYEPLPETIPEPWKMRAMRLSHLFIFVGFKLWAAITGEEEWIVVRNGLNFILPQPPPPEPADLELLKIQDTKFENISVRMYQPKTSQKKLPGLVYFHGGAFIVGTIDLYDKLVRDLAKDVNMVVVYVEYRLAPEHKYPAGFEDCVRATKYFMQRAQTFGVDPNRIGVGGDSAGGNLAAAVALKLRDIQWKPQLRTQILLYPVLQGCNGNLPVHAIMNRLIKITLKDYRGVYLCTTDEECHTYHVTKKYITPQLQKLCEKYVNDKYVPEDMIPEGFHRKPNPNIGESPGAIAMSKKIGDPYVFPLMAQSLRNLPRAYVFTAELDELRDDAVIYAQRMKEDDVQVDWVHYDNTTHGTLSLYGSKTYGYAYQRLILYLKFNL